MRNLPDLSARTTTHVRTVSQPYYKKSHREWPGFTYKNNYAVRWTGFLKINSGGKYKFFLRSDDGSKLWIDSSLVVNNDGCHGYRTRRGKQSLGSGSYSFRVEYFERGGKQGIAVKYRGEDTRSGRRLKTRRIPPSAFFLDAPPAAPLPPGADPNYFPRSAKCTKAQRKGINKIARGGNDGTTFRCNGGWCIPMKGRCNGFKNCGDNSDEGGCDQAL